MANNIPQPGDIDYEPSTSINEESTDEIIEDAIDELDVNSEEDKYGSEDFIKPEQPADPEDESEEEYDDDDDHDDDDDDDYYANTAPNPEDEEPELEIEPLFTPGEEEILNQFEEGIEEDQVDPDFHIATAERQFKDNHVKLDRLMNPKYWEVINPEDTINSMFYFDAIEKFKEFAGKRRWKQASKYGIEVSIDLVQRFKKYREYYELYDGYFLSMAELLSNKIVELKERNERLREIGGKSILKLKDEIEKIRKQQLVTKVSIDSEKAEAVTVESLEKYDSTVQGFIAKTSDDFLDVGCNEEKWNGIVAEINNKLNDLVSGGSKSMGLFTNNFLKNRSHDEIYQTILVQLLVQQRRLLVGRFNDRMFNDTLKVIINWVPPV